ncbi:MAG: 16S rRNA (cytidine(1402)-2'-O)-methyltransferase [Oscillospiraceae bacterium]|nr:16S rRNA (cytidine(1402)-2'-O)-methyltransferase [Oscillospiraceae bacterium]
MAMESVKKGTLYIVATPIGNLGDLTPRAAAVFAGVDFIAAEDTRVTLKLLRHLDIKKELVSYYEHNLRERGDYILGRIAAGESCALCSDAGMPCVSDPGEVIVRDALARGVPVTPIPAASAAVTALAVSGQATGRFCFEGFLPMNKNQRRAHLDDLLHEKRTMIFYEAPHKLRATMDDLCRAFGGERSVTLCRELTKLHEEIQKTTLAEAAAFYETHEPRGEYVLVLAGAPAAEAAEAPPTIEEAAQLARRLMAEEGLTPAAACKKAAAGTPYSKSELYKQLL